MDKIRKALDKARFERSQLTGALAEREPERVAVQPSSHARDASLAAQRALRDHDGLHEPSVSLEHARSVPFTSDRSVLERNRILQPHALGPAASALRLLRTQVLKRMRERDWRTIGIASARSADGKTTVAANLAVTIATDPRHTALLVDLDLRRPTVAALFGISPQVGVDDVLAGRSQLDLAFTHPESIGRLRLLPARAAVPNSSSVVAGAECHAMVAELRERFVNRIVLFDMPPVLEADDAVTLASQFDCLLLVVSEGRTAREDLTRTLALIRDTPVVGTVLNRSVEAIHSEAYG